MAQEKNQEPERLPNLAPPRVAFMLIHRIIPNSLKDFILGDMQEEFTDLLTESPQKARYWYWGQTLIVGAYFLVRNSLVIKAALFCSLSLSLTLFLVLVLTIVWMSHIDSHVTAEVVEGLLNGKIHHFLLDPHLLGYGYEMLAKKFEVNTFFHIPSLIWAALSIGILVIKSRCKRFSMLSFTVLSTTLMFLPYMTGFLYINLLDTAHEPAFIGPVIATMVFPILYLIIPLWLLGLTKSQLFHKGHHN